ncbi:MAG: hypothetical protein J6V35_05300 [Bacteroidales bacterium]|nr:hypothetical protein [Bacteroidales bacterium]
MARMSQDYSAELLKQYLPLLLEDKNMNLTILEIIKELESQAHKIEYTKRQDGGYIIRKIDGQHFSGKTGNAFARRMVGATLSQARQVQLARIRTPKGTRAKKLQEVPDEVKRALRKVQRSWRKKHPDIRGTASMKNVRWYLRTYGTEATLQSLDKSYRYSQGYAYIDNVLHLINRIQNDLSIEYDEDMERVVSLIENKLMVFREEWISHCYEAVYEWEKGSITGQECARRIKAIIS